MKTIRLIIPLLMLALTACTGQTYSPIVPLAVPSKFTDDYWSAFLHQVVTPDGYVDWTKIQSNSTATRDQLLTYCGLLEEISPGNHPEFFVASADQEAYWINAYNAEAILAVANANFPDPIPTPDPFAGPPQAAVFPSQTFSIGLQK